MQEDVYKNNVLEFVIFCIEGIASRLHMSAITLYDELSGEADIIEEYIIPEYDVLHTQGKEYIFDDIIEVMRERGIAI